MPYRELLPQSTRAHELYGDYWFNGEPVIVSAMQGSVILVFFWDYACAGSLRSIPYIQEWHRKYEPFGLIVVGVHTPQFDFGRNPEELEKAIRRLGIRFRVVMDNNGLIAGHYGTRTCPTLCLIDKNGYVRVQIAGEGNYLSTERLLQGMLYETGVAEELPLPMEPLRESDRDGAVCYKQTPEIQAGYLRGSLGNVEGYSPESTVLYHDPGIYVDGRLYAEGIWQNHRDSLRLEAGQRPKGQIILDYQGLDVAGVLGAGGKKSSLEVTVRQDERFLTTENKGDDVRVSADGKSVLVVKEPRLYSIVKNREYGEHLVRFSTGGNAFTVYSFSFGTAAISEMISHN